MQIFYTRQFKAGNSTAVRIPADMAFPPRTELVVIRDGNRIVVEPKAENLGGVPEMFAALGKRHNGKRPEWEDTERDWGSGNDG
jgi:antitoxin VapB